MSNWDLLKQKVKPVKYTSDVLSQSFVDAYIKTAKDHGVSADEAIIQIKSLEHAARANH